MTASIYDAICAALGGGDRLPQPQHGVWSTGRLECATQPASRDVLTQPSQHSEPGGRCRDQGQTSREDDGAARDAVVLSESPDRLSVILRERRAVRYDDIELLRDTHAAWHLLRAIHNLVGG